MDGGACRTTVCRVTQSQTQLKRLSPYTRSLITIFKQLDFCLFSQIWLRWVSAAWHWLCLVLLSGATLFCGGLLTVEASSLRSTGSRHVGFSSGSRRVQQLWYMGLVAVWWAGIFLDQGWNACPLHWQVDSHPLRHQGNLIHLFNNQSLHIYYIQSAFLCPRKR